MADRFPSYPFAFTSTHFVIFCVFLTVVFLLGGSSRDDVSSLIILRPVAILVCGYALSVITREQLQALRWPLALLLALVSLMLLQLVPLPPALWMALPVREVPIAIAEAMAAEQPWRPLTMSPAKTWNSLFSLSVPLATLLLMGLLDSAYRRRIWTVIAVLAAASAILGVMQLSGPTRGPLYLYPITNHGWAVGLFANRNHQGVFLATAILAIVYCFVRLNPRDDRAGLHAVLLMSALLLVLPMVLLAGSRAGLIVGGLGLIGSVWLLSTAAYLPARIRLGRKRHIGRRSLIGICALMLALPIILAIAFSRGLAVDRLLTEDNSEGLRLELLPVFGRMFTDFFPFGAGFGSFEHVFKIYEPVESLNPRYLNLAHNDWAQWGIEAGLPGIVLIALMTYWLGRSLFDAITTPVGEDRTGRLAAAMMLVGFAIGSLFDYPVRAPSIMAMVAILCALIGTKPVNGKPHGNGIASAAV
jgi:hypothetical protein